MIKGLVSIVIPCYLKEKYLEDTLASVVGQTYPNWECIVVNDGSTDESEMIAKRFCNTDCRFHYIAQENVGPSIARNNGIKASRGEFILPLDADDIISSTYIEKAVRYFTLHPETKLVYCKADCFGEIIEPWDLPEYNYDDFIWSNCIFSAALYKRKDFDETNGYNPNMKYGMEDWDFWLSLLKKGDYVHRIDETLFHYRKVGDSRDATQTSLHQKETYQQLALNHSEIYADYLSDIVFLHKKNRDLSNSVDYWHNEAIKARNSHAYTIGRAILKPLYFIRKFRW
jgi:glycosyltransferase involved in cell wall biosynthesis